MYREWLAELIYSFTEYSSLKKFREDRDFLFMLDLQVSENERLFTLNMYHYYLD